MRICVVLRASWAYQHCSITYFVLSNILGGKREALRYTLPYLQDHLNNRRPLSEMTVSSCCYRDGSPYESCHVPPDSGGGTLNQERTTSGDLIRSSNAAPQHKLWQHPYLVSFLHFVSRGLIADPESGLQVLFSSHKPCSKLRFLAPKLSIA